MDLKSLSKKFQLPAKNIEDIEIALLYFDSLIYSDKHDSAAKLIDKIAKLSMSLTLPDSLTRSIWARKKLIHKKEWLLYLAGINKLPSVSITSWMENYLSFRRTSKKKFLNTKHLIPKDLPKTFKEQWTTLRAGYYYSHSNFTKASQLYLQASKVSSPGKIEYLKMKSSYMLYLEASAGSKAI